MGILRRVEETGERGALAASAAVSLARGSPTPPALAPQTRRESYFSRRTVEPRPKLLINLTLPPRKCNFCEYIRS